MNRYQLLRLYAAKYPTYEKLIYINHKDNYTDEIFLEGLNEQIQAIQSSQTMWNKLFMPTEF